MANHRADGRAQRRKCRATGGTHRDATLPASAVKVGVLGALATATIAAPLAAAAAGIDEEGPIAEPPAPAQSIGTAEGEEPVALPVADVSQASSGGAEGATTVSREQSDEEAAGTEGEEEDAVEFEVEVSEPEAAEATDSEGDGEAEPTSSGYLKPVSGSITSGYGNRVHPVLGTSKMHNGVDIGAGCGTPVKAAKAGTVIATEWNDASGNRVKVDHGNGVVTGYYHLQGFATSTGDTVEAGEVVGYVGSTGRSTGCHLHFSKMDEAGNYSDPMSLLR